MALELKKRAQEIQQIEEIRNKAPKDEKGFPIIPEPELAKSPLEPYEEAGQVGDREYAESFFPRYFTYERELVSAITASYDVLVSGVYKDDRKRGFIIRINNAAAPDQPNRKQFDFEDVGAIRFMELIDDRIAIFSYGDGQKGYFDLLNNVVEFHPYER